MAIAMPSPDLYNKDIRTFAALNLNKLEVPEPKVNFEFTLLIQENQEITALYNGVLYCMAITHIPVTGYIADDLRSDCDRVLAEIPKYM